VRGVKRGDSGAAFGWPLAEAGVGSPLQQSVIAAPSLSLTTHTQHLTQYSARHSIATIITSGVTISGALDISSPSDLGDHRSSPTLSFSTRLQWRHCDTETTGLVCNTEL
jgi:hypothetical protein